MPALVHAAPINDGVKRLGDMTRHENHLSQLETSILLALAPQWYEKGWSSRWSDGYVGVFRLGEIFDVLVYIDDGKVTAVDACTFGGDPWPRELDGVTLVRWTGGPATSGERKAGDSRFY